MSQPQMVVLGRDGGLSQLRNQKQKTWEGALVLFEHRVCPPQLPLTWSSTRRLSSRAPTWRTAPCSCSSAPWRRTASQPRPPRPTPPQATDAFCASPPRSTTTGSPTSDPRTAATRGSGMTATGEPSFIASSLHWPDTLQACIGFRIAGSL